MGSAVSIQLSSCTENIEENIKPNPFKLMGLKNYGYSCYVNSVIQLLFNCIDFKEKMSNFIKKYRNIIDKNSINLEICLYKLFRELEVNNPISDGYISPRYFIDVIYNKSNIFGYNEQQVYIKYNNYL